MSVYEIDDINDRRIAVYRDLPRAGCRPGQFVVEGKTLVARLLESGFDVDSMLTDESHRDLTASLGDSSAPIFVANKQLLDQIVGFRFHRGLLACGRRKSPTKLDDFLRSVRRRAVLTVCDRVVDQENMGGVIRNSVALGAGGILLGPGCADPLSRRVLRVSMGASLKMIPMESTDLLSDIRGLRRAGFRIVVAMLDENAIELADCPRHQRVAVVFGNEGHGLSEEWKDNCDEVVTIQMHGDVDSLNVAAASAVFLHHFVRE